MHEAALTSTLLGEVSRSFALSVRVLPQPLREPIAAGYLLARLTDTLADESAVTLERRLRWLSEFETALGSGGARGFCKMIAAEARPAHFGEATLVRRAGECFQKLNELPAADQADIRWVLDHVVRGQRLDVERFGGGAAALPDGAALEKYTHLVAGCVGEFWTRLGFRHCRSYTARLEVEMRALGENFGMGLQLVNILRDVQADLRNGRCYLPEEELRAAGVTSADVFARPSLAAPVFARWLTRAESLLADGYRYIEAVRPFRMRYACFLPWHLGIKTLQLLRAQSPLETVQRLKITRAAVRQSMVWAFAAASSNLLLRQTAPRAYFVRK